VRTNEQATDETLEAGGWGISADHMQQCSHRLRHHQLLARRSGFAAGDQTIQHLGMTEFRAHQFQQICRRRPAKERKVERYSG
jgi:hypothetical protein